MIAPDMATMLSFIFTDAPIGARALQALLTDGVADTFNAVTIDGDTSTSDTLMAFATGAALDAPRIVKANDPRLKSFRAAFNAVLANLAEQVARDAKAPQACQIRSRAQRRSLGAQDRRCRSRTLAGENRHRGEDANWGRVVMRWKAGEPADRDKLSIWSTASRVAP